MRSCRHMPSGSYQLLPSCSQLLASIEQHSPNTAAPIGRARPETSGVCQAPLITNGPLRSSDQVITPARRAKDFEKLIDCPMIFEASLPRTARRISSGPWYSTPSQAHSVPASDVSTSHVGGRIKTPEARRCTGPAMTFPKTNRRSHGHRRNVERENLEKQQIHKKIEHDRRDLIKHWTLFLEELLPGALKSDPQVKAKNGKPNLPKKVVYQLACKYICIKQGRQDEYEVTLRAQPSDPSTSYPEKSGGNTRKTDDDDLFDDVQTDFPKTPTASGGTSPRITRGLESRASAPYTGLQEKGVWLTTIADSRGLLSVKPSMGQPKPTYYSMNQYTPSGYCYDNISEPPEMNPFYRHHGRTVPDP